MHMLSRDGGGSGPNLGPRVLRFITIEESMGYSRTFSKKIFASDFFVSDIVWVLCRFVLVIPGFRPELNRPGDR